MKASLKNVAIVGILAFGLMGIFAGASYAQGPFVNRNGYLYAPNSTSFVNPNYRITPDLSLNQYAYNARVIGRSLRQIPPYAFGYNPYPPRVYIAPTLPTYNPYLYYSPSIYSNYFMNPYYYGTYLP